MAALFAPFTHPIDIAGFATPVVVFGLFGIFFAIREG